MPNRYAENGAKLIRGAQTGRWPARRPSLASAPSLTERGQSGQTMIFMIMIMIILSFILLWNFDLHKILHLKGRCQNAGDAAALGAARWQGITLNLIGDLNIMQAIMLSSGESNAAAQISDLQARLCYAGPLIGLLAAQQAAKQNGIYVNAAFSARLSQQAANVLQDYAPIFPEPYPGCWADYGEMLQRLAEEGLAAAPDNARYYVDYAGSHFLLDPDFYDAVAGHDWCWFFFHAMSLLENYTDYHYWPALPPVLHPELPINSEIFGLGLSAQTILIPGGAHTLAEMNQLRAADHPETRPISPAVAAIPSTWYSYAPEEWTAWRSMARDGSDPFPARAAIRPQYDYAGADAAIRIEAAAERLTPGAGGNLITWTAAAKPFGYLEGPLRPDSYALVLPAFHEVRLIPVDASSAPAGGSYNLAWREHIELHLPAYMQNGPGSLQASCPYCRQLGLWEQASWRATGIHWLAATNAAGERLHTCEFSASGPPQAGGGRRRGH